MTVYYTREHEWLRVEGDVGTLGITAHAAEQLGDVVFVEMHEVGARVSSGDECGTVESVKAASEIYAPVSGEIVEVNQGPVDDPASLNAAPEGNAWLCKLRLSDPSELDALMDADAYAQLIGA